MRYSEIINEDRHIRIQSVNALRTLLTYNEVNVPPSGILRIEIMRDPYEITFPPNFTVNGNISIIQNNVVTMHGDLTVNGNLYLKEMYVISFPEKFTVNGELHLLHTVVESYPDDMFVTGKIFDNGTVYE